MSVYQRGFILPVVMVLLVFISLGVAYGFKVSLLEERMSANEGELAIARESAELALRDAKNDILGLDYKGQICSESVCLTQRPQNTRPKNVNDNSLWEDADAFMKKAGQVDAPGLLKVGSSNYGVYNSKKVIASCFGSTTTKSLWDVADWGSFKTTATCSNNSRLSTVPYGTYTGAVFPTIYGSKKPQYLIELMSGADMGVSASTKLFVRITAVGFTRSGRAHIALQELYAPF